MNAALLAQGQVNEEAEASHETAQRAAIEARLLDLHTAIPGVISSFNSQAQTAKVQPAIKRIWREQGALDLPECLDVPVQFPGAGQFALCFPVAAGDDCLLVFAERCIDQWYKLGGTQLPGEWRIHDLSDGFALMGFRSSPSRLDAEPWPSDAIELRCPSGSHIHLGQDASQALIQGTDRWTAEAQMWASAIAAVTTLAGASTGVLAPLAAGFTALQSAMQTWKTAADNASGYLSTTSRTT